MNVVRFGLLGFALFCAGCISQNQNPASVALEVSDTQNGVMLMRLQPNMETIFWVSRYDEQKQQLFDMRRVFQSGSGTFVAKKVPAGRYVPMGIVEQDHWMACMNGGTLAFDVGPGDVVYLGHVDLSPSLAALNHRVTSEGKATARGMDVYSFFDNIPPPAMTFPDGPEKALEEASAFVAKNMPDVHGTVRLARFRPVKFETGTLVTDRVCGTPF